MQLNMRAGEVDWIGHSSPRLVIVYISALAHPYRSRIIDERFLLRVGTIGMSSVRIYVTVAALPDFLCLSRPCANHLHRQAAQ